MYCADLEFLDRKRDQLAITASAASQELFYKVAHNQKHHFIFRVGEGCTYYGLVMMMAKIVSQLHPWVFE